MKTNDDADVVKPVLIVPDEMHGAFVDMLGDSAEVVKYSTTLKPVPPPVVLGLCGARADMLIVDDITPEVGELSGFEIIRSDKRFWATTGKKPRRKAQWKEETQRGGRRK